MAIALVFDDPCISWAERRTCGHMAWSALEAVTVLRDGSAAVAWLSNQEGIVVQREAMGAQLDFERVFETPRQRTKSLVH